MKVKINKIQRLSIIRAEENKKRLKLAAVYVTKLFPNQNKSLKTFEINELSYIFARDLEQL
jgi:hypothetical protein